MYITEVLTKTTTGKVSHRCILLRESYREDDKVKTRTVANLTHCPPDDIAALRWALHHPEAFVHPDDRARLLERLASDTLYAEDRALLAHLVGVLPTAPSQPDSQDSARKVARRRRLGRATLSSTLNSRGKVPGPSGGTRDAPRRRNADAPPG